MVDKYHLDGVNLDWGKIMTPYYIYIYIFTNLPLLTTHLEYPNDPNGVSCNAK